MIKMAAGADGRFINFAIDDGARGLVIEGLGRGNVTVAALVHVAALLMDAAEITGAVVSRVTVAVRFVRLARSWFAFVLSANRA